MNRDFKLTLLSLRLLFLDSWSLFVVTDILWRDFSTEAIYFTLSCGDLCGKRKMTEQFTDRR